MPYALFVVTAAPGTDMILPRAWEEFARSVETISMQSSESVLLGRGCWQLDLNSDGPALHALIAAAKEANLSCRYLLAENLFSWVIP